MQQFILIIHVLVSVSLIALILIQHGKGADVGAAFGSGASNTMFGSAGSTPFLVKVTGLLAGTFFLTSLALTYLVSSSVQPTVTPTAIHKTLSTPAPATQESGKSIPQSTAPATNVPQTPD